MLEAGRRTGVTAMTYHAELLKSYEDEIVGYAFFSSLAKGREVEDEKRKLHFLAGLETRTAQMLAPLIERYGLTARSADDLKAQGFAEAEPFAALDWVAMNAKFVEDFDRYIGFFQALEAAGPLEDKRPLRLLTQHEIALVEFARAEAAGTDFGMGHLQAYFAQVEKYAADLANPPVVDETHIGKAKA
jgi:hypothetical protein